MGTGAPGSLIPMIDFEVKVDDLPCDQLKVSMPVVARTLEQLAERDS
jgi:hypothetical protein